MFSDDIPSSWFSGPLTPQNRRKILSLESLGGGRFSVFAKIEMGKSAYIARTSPIIRRDNSCQNLTAHLIFETKNNEIGMTRPYICIFKARAISGGS